IAVIHAGAVGDMVQALPTLRAIRVKWPEARVTLIGRPERGRLAQMAGLVDACVHMDSSGLWRLAGGGRPAGPGAASCGGAPGFGRADLVIDFLGCLAGSVSEGRRRPFQIVSARAIPPADWNKSAAAWVFEQVAPRLELPPVSLEPALAVPAAILEAARGTLAANRIAGPFAVIHPGSGSPKKNWPMDRFSRIAQRLRKDWGRRVVWLLGPAEQERGVAPPVAEGQAVVADLALDEVAPVLALADVYVGNDSGITQVAAAVRTNDGEPTATVALFGPSDPRVWAPRGPHVRVIRSPDGTMAAIETEQVWHKLTDLLSISE
ncbi:MAG: glycosyltransferase family 9 protein, partial [Phycisphaerae bacterium]